MKICTISHGLFGVGIFLASTFSCGCGNSTSRSVLDAGLGGSQPVGGGLAGGNGSGGSTGAGGGMGGVDTTIASTGGIPGSGGSTGSGTGGSTSGQSGGTSGQADAGSVADLGGGGSGSCSVTASQVAGTWTATDLTGDLYSSGGLLLLSGSTTETLTVTADPTGPCLVSYVVQYPSTGYEGTCTGSITGSIITSTCTTSSTAASLTPGCTSAAPFQRTDTIDASTTPWQMTTQFEYTLASASGSTCKVAGAKASSSGTLSKSSP